MQAIGCVLFALYGIAQMYAAALGLEAYVGAGWAAAIFIACLFLRFTLPLTIAAFFCARDIWDWHWALALVFVAPGLLFIIPSVISGLLETARSAAGRGPNA